MHEHEEFLWTGLRTRLEGMGRARPRMIRLEADGQSPDRHPEGFFHPVRPALRGPHPGGPAGTHPLISPGGESPEFAGASSRS